MLIAEDDAHALAELERLMARPGNEVRGVRDGAAALSAFEGFGPELVLSAVEMPTMSGLELLAEIRKRTCDTIVVMMTAEDGDEPGLQAMRLGANGCLRKPCRSPDLLSLTQRHARTAECRKGDGSRDGQLLRREFTLQVENRLERLPAVVNSLSAEIGQGQRDLDVHLGLMELLVNAVEHGNLEITPEQKEAALQRTGGLARLYEERLADPRLSCRRVTVRFTEDAAGTREWLIRDEGRGFDWQALPESPEAPGEGRLSGRGVFLCRMLFDRLEYSGAGNVVRATMYAEPEAAPNEV